MRVSEWLVLGWCLVTIAVALWRPLAPRARRRVVAAAVTLAVLVLAVAALPDMRWTPLVRNLAPAGYVPIAYWVTAGFFDAPDTRLESWLAAVDRRWLGRWHPEGWLRRSRWRRDLLEAAYLSIYITLPLGTWAAYAAAGDAAVDWYWSVVFPAEGLSYLGLAWWRTRPPRAIEPWMRELRSASALRGVNETLLARTSHLMNTIPSGHAAGAVAVALALVTLGAPGGAGFAMAAAGVCAATVLGRYHFLVDTVAGAALATCWWLLALLLR